jgi:ubiquinone/menaquinone biosynthesis C-methylase UbiE
VSTTFEMTREAAVVYDDRFVPALFAEWAPELVAIADVRPGHRVLDVACGTGVVARSAADTVGPAGRVAGIDRAEAMVRVAAERRPDLEWHHGDARSLPFPDATFDAALCQASLMFIDDPADTLREMRRVVGNGTVAAQVWGRLAASPGVSAFADVVARHAGPEAVDLWGAYFRLGDLEGLTALFDDAGLAVVATRTRLGAIRMPSTDEYVAIEVQGTPLADVVTGATYDRVLEDARVALRPFETAEGVELPIEGHLVAARPR